MRALPRKFLDFCVENGAFWCTLSAIYTDCSYLKLYRLLCCTSSGRTSLIAVVNCGGQNATPPQPVFLTFAGGVRYMCWGVEPPNPPGKSSPACCASTRPQPGEGVGLLRMHLRPKKTACFLLVSNNHCGSGWYSMRLAWSDIMELPITG